MPAIRKNSNRSLKDLSRGVNFFLFFRAEYIKRRLRKDLIAGTWFSKEDIQRAHKKVRGAIVRYYSIEHTANIHNVIIKSAVAHMHNSLATAPQHVYNTFENPLTHDEMKPLLKDCDSELWLMREISHQYGFFYNDLLQAVYPGRIILEMLIAGKTSVAPIPFPMKNDGQGSICEFRYLGDIDGQQYFDEEIDQHIYIYTDALNSSLDHVQKDIEKILSELPDKSGTDKDSFGDKKLATMQISLKKPVNPKQYKDILTLCRYAVEHYQTQYKNPNGYLDLRPTQQQKLLWLIYGEDNSRLDFEGQAIGLWLWDLIEIEKKKLREAIEIVKNSPIKHCRQLGKDIDRQLKRDLQKIRKIINTIIP